MPTAYVMALYIIRCLITVLVAPSVCVCSSSLLGRNDDGMEVVNEYDECVTNYLFHR